jgi:hypothetical protein
MYITAGYEREMKVEFWYFKNSSMITAIIQVHKLHKVQQIHIDLLRFFKTSIANAPSNIFHAQNTNDDILFTSICKQTA